MTFYTKSAKLKKSPYVSSTEQNLNAEIISYHHLEALPTVEDYPKSQTQMEQPKLRDPLRCNGFLCHILVRSPKLFRARL